MEMWFCKLQGLVVRATATPQERCPDSSLTDITLPSSSPPVWPDQRKWDAGSLSPRTGPSEKGKNSTASSQNHQLSKWARGQGNSPNFQQTQSHHPSQLAGCRTWNTANGSFLLTVYQTAAESCQLWCAIPWMFNKCMQSMCADSHWGGWMLS